MGEKFYLNQVIPLEQNAEQEIEAEQEQEVQQELEFEWHNEIYLPLSSLGNLSLKHTLLNGTFRLFNLGLPSYEDIPVENRQSLAQSLLDHFIYQVSPDARDYLLKHINYFKQGLDMYCLPQGFLLSENPNKKGLYRLDYFQTMPNKKKSPLQISISDDMKHYSQTRQRDPNLEAEIKTLSENERHWFTTLLQAHADNGASGDFKTLFNAFVYFKTKLKKQYQIDLPSTCPQFDIHSMQILFSSILHFLKKSPMEGRSQWEALMAFGETTPLKRCLIFSEVFNYRFMNKTLFDRLNCEISDPEPLREDASESIKCILQEMGFNTSPKTFKWKEALLRHENFDLINQLSCTGSYGSSTNGKYQHLGIHIKFPELTDNADLLLSNYLYFYELKQNRFSNRTMLSEKDYLDDFYQNVARFKKSGFKFKAEDLEAIKTCLFDKELFDFKNDTRKTLAWMTFCLENGLEPYANAPFIHFVKTIRSKEKKEENSTLNLSYLFDYISKLNLFQSYRHYGQEQNEGFFSNCSTYKAWPYALEKYYKIPSFDWIESIYTKTNDLKKTSLYTFLFSDASRKNSGPISDDELKEYDLFYNTMNQLIEQNAIPGWDKSNPSLYLNLMKFFHEVVFLNHKPFDPTKINIDLFRSAQELSLRDSTQSVLIDFLDLIELHEEIYKSKNKNKIFTSIRSDQNALLSMIQNQPKEKTFKDEDAGFLNKKMIKKQVKHYFNAHFIKINTKNKHDKNGVRLDLLPFFENFHYKKEAKLFYDLKHYIQFLIAIPSIIKLRFSTKFSFEEKPPNPFLMNLLAEQAKRIEPFVNLSKKIESFKKTIRHSVIAEFNKIKKNPNGYTTQDFLDCISAGSAILSEKEFQVFSFLLSKKHKITKETVISDLQKKHPFILSLKIAYPNFPIPKSEDAAFFVFNTLKNGKNSIENDLGEITKDSRLEKMFAFLYQEKFHSENWFFVLEGLSKLNDDKITNIIKLLPKLNAFEGTHEERENAFLLAVKQMGRYEDFYLHVKNEKQPSLFHLAKKAYEIQAVDLLREIDPHQKRSADFIKNQFDLSRLSGTLSLLSLSKEETNLIKNSIRKITSLGRDLPLNPSLKPAIALSNKALLDALEHWKKQENSSEKDLHLIAILRELLYRHSGEFLNTSQLTVILLNIKDDPNLSNLMQIKTGEGKSAISVFLNAFWALKGERVINVTSNKLLSREQFKNYEGFMNSVGIKDFSYLSGRKFISKNNVPINDSAVFISDPGSLSDYFIERERAGTQKEKTRILIDECDAFFLDFKTRCNYVNPISMSEKKIVHETVLDFAREILFKTHRGKSEFDLDMLCEELFDFCRKKETDLMDYFTALDRRDRMKSYLRSALRALTLKENVDYVEQKIENQNLYRANIITGEGEADTQSKWSESVHTFLHIILNQKYNAKINTKKGKPIKKFIPIEEKQILDSNSYDSLLKTILSYGPITAISGTIGSEHELNEIEQDFFDEPRKLSITRMPKHWKNKTRHHPFVLAETKDEQFAEIVKQIQLCRETKQPILIFAESIDEANILFEDLKKVFPTHIQMASAKNTAEEDDEIVKKAGENKMITISTLKMGRGVNIKTKHPKGLFNIITFPASERRKGQAEGRTGRQGAPGDLMHIHALSQYKEIPKPLHDKLINAAYYRDKKAEKIHEVDRKKRLLIQLATYLKSYGFALLDEKRSDQDAASILKLLQIELHSRLPQHADWTNAEFETIRKEMESLIQVYIKNTLKIEPNLQKIAALKPPTLKQALHKKEINLEIEPKYHPKQAGKAVIRNRLFSELSATLKGERAFFANTRAARQGKGLLFADTRSTLKRLFSKEDTNYYRPLFANTRAAFAKWKEERHLNQLNRKINTENRSLLKSLSIDSTLKKNLLALQKKDPKKYLQLLAKNNDANLKILLEKEIFTFFERGKIDLKTLVLYLNKLDKKEERREIDFKDYVIDLIDMHWPSKKSNILNELKTANDFKTMQEKAKGALSKSTLKRTKIKTLLTFLSLNLDPRQRLEALQTFERKFFIKEKNPSPKLR